MVGGDVVWLGYAKPRSGFCPESDHVLSQTPAAEPGGAVAANIGDVDKAILTGAARVLEATLDEFRISPDAALEPL